MSSSVERRYDVAVVGAGILGLAHAWMAHRAGLKTVLFDRTPQACGATVRNFGMIWPIGQPKETYSLAMRSRELWLELVRQNVLPADQCGSVHLAHNEDELAVMEEFVALGEHQCEILSADEVQVRVPIANPRGLLGGLWSPTELRVDPRTAASRIASWLSEQGVTINFGTAIVDAAKGKLVASDGGTWHAAKTIICSGSDLQTLLPDVFSTSGLRQCKLQMLRTRSQGESVRQTCHVASGLTLRHYTSFESCPSLISLRERIRQDTPELDQYGIHVMATQSADGSLILGDSHEFDDDISPFDKSAIDALILRELQKIIDLPSWDIAERWHGIYTKLPGKMVFEATPMDAVHVCVGAGGAGMTMAFGIAEQTWKRWAS